MYESNVQKKLQNYKRYSFAAHIQHNRLVCEKCAYNKEDLGGESGDTAFLQTPLLVVRGDILTFGTEMELSALCDEDFY